MSIEYEKSVRRVPTFASDLIVDILKEHEIEFVASNIGSTFRGLWESLVNYGGDRSPQCISACHEEIAVAIAHGYAKVAGKPMVALVHDLVGLLHSTMAIYNAWCDRVPILVLGASGPMDETKRRPWIDWIHTAEIPNELVRNYVKWDNFPFSVAGTIDSLVRAYDLSVTDPCGPVFVCFDADMQEQKIGPNITLPQKVSSPRLHFPTPDSSAFEKVAKILLDARHPCILAGKVGRNPGAVKSLVELAELLGAKVYDTLERFNFPNTHPLDASDKETIKEADAIVALDVQGLERTITIVNKSTREIKHLMRPDAKLLKIGLEDLSTRSWASDYQAFVASEISILADTSTAIPKLSELCRKILNDNPSKKREVAERLERARATHDEKRELWIREARKQWDDVPISLPRLAMEVWELLRGGSWLISNGTLEGWLRRLWDWEEPGCYIGDSGGAGLGYGLPASVGAALAVKSREGNRRVVIDFQSDGDFLFTSSALWTAAHYRIPLLVVMFNNRLYFNDAEHNKLIAQSRGRDSENAFRNGGDITNPNVDFAQLASAQGVRAVGPIEKPEDLSAALKTGLEIVRRGEPALVDVVMQSR